MENIVAQSYSELAPLECAEEEWVQPERVSVERCEWLSLRWAAGYWKKMHADLKMRHELLLKEYSEVCRLNGEEMKLQRKVQKLERLLAGLSEVEGARNIVSRQGRKIKQLQKENRELKASVRQLRSASEHKDSVIARLQRMQFGRRSEKQKKGAKKDSSQAGDHDRRRRQAANWIKVGQTQGRGKLDVRNERALPIKDIWLRPLQRNWKVILNS